MVRSQFRGINRTDQLVTYKQEREEFKHKVEEVDNFFFKSFQLEESYGQQADQFLAKHSVC